MAIQFMQWPNASIAAGFRHTAGLTMDGKVTAVGDNTYGQCDVSGWRDIVALAAGNAHTGNAHTVGLRSDGTVTATGWNKHGQCEVGDWNDIAAIAAAVIILWALPRTVPWRPQVGMILANVMLPSGEISWRLRRAARIRSALERTARWLLRATIPMANAMSAAGAAYDFLKQVMPPIPGASLSSSGRVGYNVRISCKREVILMAIRDCRIGKASCKA
jgi:hypothetical protein